jgi:integrase/recombinase XerD
LMIALLALRPLRQKNFLAIEIGDHLVGARPGYMLRFTGDETKDKKSFQAPFPTALEGVLARYLEHYRPILLRTRGVRNPAYPGQPAGRHLWVSKGGTTFTPGAMQKALERHTRPRFGHVVNTHLFRDCVATTIAYDDPEHIRICARILGHSHFSTTEGYYIVAKTVSAADHYHDLIESIRASPRSRARRD